MYPPFEDHIDRRPDRSIQATTRGHTINITPGGTMTIVGRNDPSKVHYHKAGIDSMQSSLDPLTREAQRLAATNYPADIESPTATTPDADTKAAKQGHGKQERNDRPQEF